MTDHHLVTLRSDVLRTGGGPAGAHLGYEHGIRRACTVHLDGEPVGARLVLGLRADGRDVRTVGSFGQDGQTTYVQRAISRHHGLQCDSCIPGFLALAEVYLATDPDPDREEAREMVSASLRRCPAYQGIVDAVCDVARARPEQTRG